MVCYHVVLTSRLLELGIPMPSCEKSGTSLHLNWREAQDGGWWLKNGTIYSADLCQEMS